MGLSSALKMPIADAYAPGLDVIIRVHDSSRLFELDRAIFSLVNQQFAPIQPVIVMQRFSSDEVEAVR
ncbi:hypothetical protein Q6298_28070, partial [Klebsiella pneumoniae]